jgi:hypothetical protein
VGQRYILLLGAIAVLAPRSALAQTTGGTWRELGPRPQIDGPNIRSGRINSIAIDLADDPSGNTVYVGSSYGGVWKTTNVLSSSPTYVPLMDSQPNLAVGSIALDPSTHPATVYVATGTDDHQTDAVLHGNGIYISSDGGQTWALATSADNGAHPFQQVGFSKVLVDPSNPNIVLAGAIQQVLSQPDTPQPFAGIYRSTDRGATWSRVFGTGFIPSCVDLIYESVHGVYYAAIAGQGIFKSTNQGATWNAAASPFATASVSPANFFNGSLATRSGMVWALLVDNTDSNPSIPTPCTSGVTRCDTGLAQSNDGGASWAPVALPPLGGSHGSQLGHLKVLGAPPNSTELILGNVLMWLAPAPDGLATSWTSVGANFFWAGDHHSIAFFDDRRWLVGSDLGFAFTGDAATADFKVISGNLGTTLSRAAGQMGNGAYITNSQDNGVAESGTGTTWTQLVFPAEGYLDASLIQPNQYFSAPFEAILNRSDDNGKTQVTVVDATIDSIGLTPFRQLPADPTQIILGTCRIWKGPTVPTSPGAGWAPISPDLTSNGSGTGPCKPGPGAISAFAGAPSLANVMYAVTLDGHVQKTTTGTSASPTWSDVTHSPLPNSSAFPFHSVAVSPADSNTAYVGMGGTGSGHIFVTRDGGTTWTNITGNLPDLSPHAILIDPLAPQDIYLGTAAGVFVITDGGRGGTNETWQQYGKALPNAEVFGLEFSKVGSRQIIAATYGRGVWAIAPIVVPAVQLSPTSVTFSPQVVATTSAAQAITLTNNGAGALAITGIAVNGTNSGDFAETNTCGTSVAASASCTISVTFTPAAVGTRSASVAVSDAATGSPQTVALTGAGVDFSLGVASGGSMTSTVTAGQTATYNLQICTGAPAAATCSVSPASVMLGGATPSQFMVSVVTTSRSMVVPWTRPLATRPLGDLSVELAMLLLMLALAMTLALLRAKRPKLTLILPTTMLLGAMLLAGCGGGSYAPPSPPTVKGTPAGTYTVTVTGTAGSASRNISLTLVVN